ncbi:hypothetical protein H5410_028322 [Solanum commersonii]|uniref:Helicase C-terminal domain-containing protein n=1 Tax=Solanum commersonii TaxID=4109 RepID=A0A9J5Z757_SOLCO|nr:hypothetical protein H5410_028322 [Solanum commersonii]
MYFASPSCFKSITMDFIENDQKTKATIKGFRSSSILNKNCRDNFQTSTKIEALSQQKTFLVCIWQSGISYVQLDGSMTITARDSAITRFTNDPDCIIFFMSLKADGLCRNLTVASHVFLVDPWWNAAVERQSQDRIHRIGQYKPIRCVLVFLQLTIQSRREL